MRALEEPWHLVQQELLKAYSMDSLRAEPIKVIIDHYLSVGEWQLAYLYSTFAISALHGKNPYPTRLLFVDESLYIWRFLEVHAAACFYTNRKDDGKKVYQELLNIIKTNPQYFTPEDITKIQQNAPFFS